MTAAILNLYVQGLPLAAYVFVLVAIARTIQKRHWPGLRGFGVFLAGAILAYPVVLIAHWAAIARFTWIDTEFAGFGFAMLGNMVLLAFALLIALPFAFLALYPTKRDTSQRMRGAHSIKS